MAFIPVPGAVRIVVQGTTDRAPVVNVLHAGIGVAPSGVNTAAWAQAVYDAWEAYFLPYLSVNYQLNAVQVYDLSAQDGFLGTYGEGGVNGSVAGPSQPYDSAVCITLRSASRGRSARGRVYLGPVAETSADNGVISAELAGGISDSMDAFRSAIALAGLFLAVVSYETNGAPRAQGAIYPVVSTEIRSRILASQARRAARP